MKPRTATKIILLMTATVVMLWYSGAVAVNNFLPDPAQSNKARAALAVIEKGKADARAEASKALWADLTPVERDWGIKLFDIHRTAAGYMLEMKFRVLDRNKAFPLLKRDIKRYLIVEKNGAVLEVPFTQKLGSLKSTVRTSNMVRKDHNYLALFANPAKHVQPGDKVTLVIGNFMAEHLTVQ